MIHRLFSHAESDQNDRIERTNSVARDAVEIRVHAEQEIDPHFHQIEEAARLRAIRARVQAQTRSR
jgi:hypothetical protein